MLTERNSRLARSSQSVVLPSKRRRAASSGVTSSRSSVPAGSRTAPCLPSARCSLDKGPPDAIVPPLGSGRVDRSYKTHGGTFKLLTTKRARARSRLERSERISLTSPVSTTGTPTARRRCASGSDQTSLLFERNMTETSSGGTPLAVMSHETSRATPSASSSQELNRRNRASPGTQCAAAVSGGRAGASRKSLDDVPSPVKDERCAPLAHREGVIIGTGVVVFDGSANADG